MQSMHRHVLATLCLVITAVAGCQDCREDMDEQATEDYEAHSSCYATSPAEVLGVAREVLLEEEWTILGDDAERFHLETEWKDTTRGSTRLTTGGEPSRIRIDILVVPGDCVRLVVHDQNEVWREAQSTETHRWEHVSNSSTARELRREMHSRLREHSRSEPRIGWESRP